MGLLPGVIGLNRTLSCFNLIAHNIHLDLKWEFGFSNRRRQECVHSRIDARAEQKLNVKSRFKAILGIWVVGILILEWYKAYGIVCCCYGDNSDFGLISFML